MLQYCACRAAGSFASRSLDYPRRRFVPLQRIVTVCGSHADSALSPYFPWCRGAGRWSAAPGRATSPGALPRRQPGQRPGGDAGRPRRRSPHPGRRVPLAEENATSLRDARGRPRRSARVRAPRARRLRPRALRARHRRERRQPHRVVLLRRRRAQDRGDLDRRGRAHAAPPGDRDSKRRSTPRARRRTPRSPRSIRRSTRTASSRFASRFSPASARRRGRGLTAAERALAAAEARERDARLALEADVAAAYWDVYAAERDLAVRLLLRDQARALLGETEARATGRSGRSQPDRQRPGLPRRAGDRRAGRRRASRPPLRRARVA